MPGADSSTAKTRSTHAKGSDIQPQLPCTTAACCVQQQDKEKPEHYIHAVASMQCHAAHRQHAGFGHAGRVRRGVQAHVRVPRELVVRVPDLRTLARRMPFSNPRFPVLKQYSNGGAGGMDLELHDNINGAPQRSGLSRIGTMHGS